MTDMFSSFTLRVTRQLRSFSEEPATPDLLQLSKLQEIVAKGSELCDIILEHDIDANRSLKARQMVKQAISIYQVLLKEKRQTKPGAKRLRVEEVEEVVLAVEEVVAATEDEDEEKVDDVEAVENDRLATMPVIPRQDYPRAHKDSKETMKI
ncbi:hypothetical protein E2C01_081128 [Portunus trituberculatus]|uniref:Uncharacterized protein n=1 Tax=Portunus trituberculatus TaxID=210409 RepID=A0A5B7IUZ4_PORTR|nr:hypothetical protein [Portunus trituberculatus]